MNVAVAILSSWYTSSVQPTVRFKFEGATPERLAKALLRQVPKDTDTIKPRVPVQLAENEPMLEDPDTGDTTSGNTTTSLRDDPESSSTR